MRLILPYRASRKSSGDYQGICVRKGIISVAVLLILIMDQRRNLPVFMRILKHGEAKRRWAIAMHTSIKKPGSDYALPGLRCRYVPVSRPGKHSATGQQDSAQQLESNHPDNRADRAEDSFHHRPGLQRLCFGRAGKFTEQPETGVVNMRNHN